MGLKSIISMFLNCLEIFLITRFLPKLDLRNGYFHIPIYPPHRTYFGFSFKKQYYVFNVLCFGYSPAPDFFQDFMSSVREILQSQEVPCGVELDDILVYSEGKDNSLRATQLAISILEFAGFKIKFSKSIIAPTQVIDYLGYTLDARKQCFCVQKNKLVKCKLILNSVCRKLMEQLFIYWGFSVLFLPSYL